MQALKYSLILSIFLAPTASFANSYDNLDRNAPKPPPPSHARITPEQQKEHLIKIQAHNLKMHALSNQILAETDPVKAQKLKDEQIDLMLLKIEHRKKHRMEMRKHKPELKKPPIPAAKPE